MKAIVIGAGILGLSTAWRLAHSGVQTTLLESAQSLGDGATSATFAWLNAANKTPQNYYQLNVDGMNYYNRLATELHNPRWLHPSGRIEWHTSSDAGNTLNQKIERLRDWGYSVETLPITDLPRIDPGIRAPEGIENFVYFPHEGYVQPHDMLGHLAQLCIQSGVELVLNTEATGFIEQSGKVAGVTSASGEHFHADIVVSCVGAASEDLLGTLNFSVPMASSVGAAAITTPTTGYFQAICQNDGVHFRPDGAGRIFMRSQQLDMQNFTESDRGEAIADQMLESVQQVIPLAAGASIDAIRVTTRPVPADGLPFVGHVPGIEGIYLMVTHSGATLGPLLADIATREITSDFRDPRLSTFRPGRELNSDRDRRNQNV